MKSQIFKEGQRYSFRDYFNLPYPTEDITAALGYGFRLEQIQFEFPGAIDAQVIANLSNDYYRILPKITINSEIAKREFLIAPLLREVILTIDAKLSIEYPINVSERLNGIIDYLIRSQQQLVVIEAKKGDLDRGFNQLAAEMIALDQFEEGDGPAKIYGSVTLGEIWRFAILDRKKKVITKDINLLRFPQDLEAILGTILGIFV
jgi:hypothetical protein